jgi:hypothetical protein
MSCNTSKEHVNSCLKLGGLTPVSLVRQSGSDYANSLADTVLRLARELSSYLLGLQKQKFVADSSCYAEYIALHQASHKVVFLRELISCLLPPTSNPTHQQNVKSTYHTYDHFRNLISFLAYFRLKIFPTKWT